ncbi:hypothetical protein [Arenibaculum sp.]|uniref:alpha/beta hydrolase family esterase n=1 Tax=Arenibaculum sp. TaxID=2865862 RepID=UPI002E112CC3|nr:hypothetical protein [Arenibaculum sp.]
MGAIVPVAVALLLSAASAAAAAPSPGCGRAPPAAPPDALSVEGASRPLIVDLPEGYDADRPHRLVVAFHGRTSPPARVRRYYDLDQAEGGRTIFVYPEARRQADGTYIWRMPEDLVLFETILERFGDLYCIAGDEVFAVGHSLGATFVNSLACARGDLLRGVGTVAGGIAPEDCTGSVAAMLLHHPEDELVPIDLGRAARDLLVAQNDLPERPRPADPRVFNCRRYGSADADNPVLWCPHDQAETGAGRYYPHQWPAGTGEAFMEFFATLD